MTSSLVNQTLLNRFRVDAYVAAGGMGVVYRAWDLKRNVHLAMKVLHADLAEDPAILRRFEREARALEQLAHPNIVPFYGLHQTNDFTFLLERYIDGPSFKQILREHPGQPLPMNEALACFKALSAALGYAHAHGVVHSDVKPGNVMVDQGGSIYLADFGIARHAESTVTTLGVAGSPAYMAPEQIRGEPVGPATDVYAMGVMVFELLTGTRPFRGNETSSERSGATAAERMRYSHQFTPPPNPQELNPELPAALAQVILKALAKSPAERFASVQEFFQEICGALGLAPESVPDRIVSQVRSGLSTAFAGSAASVTSPVNESTAPVGAGAILGAGRFSRQTIVGLLVGGALLLIIAGFFIFRPGRGETLEIAQDDPAGLGAVETVGPDNTAAVSSTPTGRPSTFTPTRTVTPIPEPTKTSTPVPGLDRYELAFVSDRDGNFGTYLLDLENPRSWKALPKPPDYEVVWWPTWCGEQIAAEVADLNGGMQQWIYLIDPRSNQTSQYSPPEAVAALGVPRCSPNARYMSYSGNVGEDWMLKVADTAAKQVVFAMPGDMRISGYVSWFRNNQDFIFMGRQQEFVIFEATNFDANTVDNISPPQTTSGQTITAWKYPAISPDETQLAFTCEIGNRWHLCLVRLGDNEAQVLQITPLDKISGNTVPGNTPNWSADGLWIYFASSIDGDWDVYRIHPDGSGLENITANSSSNELMPALPW